MLRGAVRLLGGPAALLAGGWTLRALRGAPAALGADPTAIRAVASRSPQYRGGVFHNLEHTSQLVLDREEQRFVLWELVRGRAASRAPVPIPVVRPSLPADPAELAITWLGHATALVEIDGYRVLTDPVFSRRCSPLDALGPSRLHPPPLEAAELPAVDAIVISHDHYDHLDIDTVTALARAQRAPFVVPLGVGAHLRAWGVDARRVIELDWNDNATIGDLTLTCTPARHFSGRFLTRNTTLWASWVLAGPTRRVYFGGDTGFTESFTGIGAEYGPFDATLLPIGAYNRAWPDVHMNPEEAVQAHRDVTGGVLVPIHWCTFRLAPHPWAEPAERLLAAAGDVTVVIPRPGQRLDLSRPAALDPWWRV